MDSLSCIHCTLCLGLGCRLIPDRNAPFWSSSKAQARILCTEIYATRFRGRVSPQAWFCQHKPLFSLSPQINYELFSKDKIHPSTVCSPHSFLLTLNNVLHVICIFMIAQRHGCVDLIKNVKGFSSLMLPCNSPVAKSWQPC